MPRSMATISTGEGGGLTSLLKSTVPGCDRRYPCTILLDAAMLVSRGCRARGEQRLCECF